MPSTWTKAILSLAAIWLVAGGTIWWIRASRPTPESIVEYIKTHPLEGQSAAERRQRLDKVAAQLNSLAYEQRRTMRGGRKLDRFFRSLTPVEQGHFLDATLPAGFSQMMEALNNMPADERKKFVERALNDMDENGGREQPEGAPDELDANARKIVNEGLKSFYSEASAETKMDLSPLIEQMQTNLTKIRGRR